MARSSLFFAAWLVSLSGLLLGCGSSHKPKKEEDSKEPPIELPPSVNATNVTYKLYGRTPKTHLMYIVSSPHVNAKLGPTPHAGDSSGTAALEQGVTGHVTGTICDKDGLETSHFSADSAQATRSTPASKDLDVLTLVGHVAVHGIKPAGNLYCDRLRVEMKSQLIKARGNVHYDNGDGSIGTLPEAWANQKLTKIGTPDTFAEKQ